LGWTVSELTDRVSLTKRVVANALQDLERGGVIQSNIVGNRHRYDVVARRQLDALLGTRPARYPSWSSILPFMAGTLWLMERASERNETALLFEAQQLIEGFVAQQSRLGRVLSKPAFESWPEVASWLADAVDLVANGQSSWLDEPTVMRSPGRRKQVSR